MKNRRLIKNYVYNTMYQILVLIAPLVTTPYVSRVLGVTNIGIYQYSQSIANYFVLIGAVGTTLYGQREIAYLYNKPVERSIAFWEIEIFRLVTTIICTIFYFLIFCIHGSYPQIYAILTLEVIATAFDISWLYMGLENFKITVIRNTIIKLTGVICVFLFVKSPDDLGIYTMCVTAPMLVGNLSLWFSLKTYLVKTNLTVTLLITGIKVRLKPILVLFLPQVAQDVYLLLDKTMIGIFGSNIDQVGYYSQGQKIVKIVLLIVTSLGTVMLPTMSASFARGDTESIKKSVKTAFRFIYMLSCALLFGLCAIAPRFVPIFYGKGYEPVINLIIIISPILVIIATSNVIGKQYLLPTNQQKAYSLSIIAGACVNFFLNMILIHFWDAVGASIATVIAELAVTMVECWHVKEQLPLKQCLTSGIQYGVYGIIMFIVVRGAGVIVPQGKVWALGLMIIIGMTVYLAEMLLMKDPMVKMGLMFITDRRK